VHTGIERTTVMKKCMLFIQEVNKMGMLLTVVEVLPVSSTLVLANSFIRTFQ
jgi:hypothetical protein